MYLNILELSAVLNWPETSSKVCVGRWLLTGVNPCVQGVIPPRRAYTGAPAVYVVHSKVRQLPPGVSLKFPLVFRETFPPFCLNFKYPNNMSLRYALCHIHPLGSSTKGIFPLCLLGACVPYVNPLRCLFSNYERLNYYRRYMFEYYH